MKPPQPAMSRHPGSALSSPGATLPESVFAPAQTVGDRRETPVKRRTSNLAAVAGLVAGLVAVGASNAAASSGKAATAAREIVVARLVFSESVFTDALPATYELSGGLRGEANGRLTSRLVSLAGSNAGFRATFDWVVSSPRGSFSARTVGTWNLETGRIVMSGRVGGGYLSGAELYAQGRIFNPSRPTFEGSLRVVRDAAGMARLQRQADGLGPRIRGAPSTLTKSCCFGSSPESVTGPPPGRGSPSNASTSSSSSSNGIARVPRRS